MKNNQRIAFKISVIEFILISSLVSVCGFVQTGVSLTELYAFV